MALIAASVVTVLLCSLVSRRVEKTWLTAPILFAASATDSTSASAVLTRLLIEQLGYGALARALASHATGASMFIAAFAAGLATQWGLPDVGRQSVESTEAWCQLLNHFVFLLFGVLVARQWAHFGWPVVLYGVLSLTLVRMLPVAIALRGTGLARPTVLFMGAFGPRGLASIVLGLVYLERESRLADESTMRRAAMAKVLLSILAHGLAAQRGIRRHAATIAAFPASAPERRVPATDTEGSDTPQRRSP